MGNISKRYPLEQAFYNFRKLFSDIELYYHVYITQSGFVVHCMLIHCSYKNSIEFQNPVVLMENSSIIIIIQEYTLSAFLFLYNTTDLRI